MSKEELIKVETQKLSNIIESALEKHHKRHNWIASTVDVYNNAGKAMPESIAEFTKIYLEGLATIISKI